MGKLIWVAYKARDMISDYLCGERVPSKILERQCSQMKLPWLCHLTA